VLLSFRVLIPGVLVQQVDPAAGIGIREITAWIAIWVASRLFSLALLWFGLAAGVRFARLVRDDQR
jgi:hypothetical protein